MRSSRTKFINDLFRISRDSKVVSNYDRYRAMGRRCKLTDYFNGHATNYLYNENKVKPTLNDLNENGFVALNVEAPALETGSSPIIPFFSIKIGNSIDSTELRNSILDISQNAAEDNFLTCPEFMNGKNGKDIKLEKVLFKVNIENNAIVSISIPKLSAFDENYTEIINKDNSSLVSFLSNLKNKTFLYSWCKPFMQNDQTLFCNVRAVDRDQKLVSHSIFVTIFNTEDMVKQWVSAYGEDAMNIIAVVKSIFIEDIHKKQLRESIKSAIAAIMSRNMSHSLGSHYLYYTKVSLEQLADKTGNSGPEIRGAAKVLSYIQSRMDYLATIVVNNKYSYNSVNFKTQILDELTVDDFSKRHFGTTPNEEFRKKLNESAFRLDTAKQLLSSLISLYKDCESLNDNSFSKYRSLIDSKLLSLQNEIAEIDKKSIYNRTTNYLLTNLIRSENYSRPDILGRPHAETFKYLFLHVRLWNGKDYELFTGTNTPQEMAKEETIKDKLSNIYLALPGGFMSCHAFFNILENYIRNSAKYTWTDYLPPELIITLSLKIDEIRQIVECTIFDNKHDALCFRANNHKRTLLDEIVYRLGHSRILTDSQMIDKENKGLKEMLFSAVWLKANESNKTLAEIITDMEESKPERKIKLIRKYAFEVVPVNDEGQECLDNNQANLGIRLILPLFVHVQSLKGMKTKNLIKLHTDVVEVNNPSMTIPELGRSYKKVFPRIFSGSIPSISETPEITNRVELWDILNEYKKVYKLRYAINSNLGNIDHYTLIIESMKEPGSDKNTPTRYQIVFDTHFSTKASKSRIQEYYGKYAYVDTISGNNFTKTLQGLFISGLNLRGRKFKNYNDYYLNLKIKESGITRITIIDERLFNTIRWNENIAEKLSDESIPDNYVMDIRSTAAELSLKNIRVLNFWEGQWKSRLNKLYKRVNKMPFLYGNSFFDIGPCKDYPNATHFLSIHLGLIEKLLKSSKLEKYIGERGMNPLGEHRIARLMCLFESVFGEGLNCGTHICIHSGRGDYSKELDGPLREYPFLSLAALENSFNNSKYLLSQLFYNTIYIGKGEVNQ